MEFCISSLIGQTEQRNGVLHLILDATDGTTERSFASHLRYNRPLLRYDRRNNGIEASHLRYDRRNNVTEFCI